MGGGSSKPVRAATQIAMLCVCLGWGVGVAVADQQRLTGLVVDFNRDAGTCEIEVLGGSGGGFTTLHLDHDAMWALKKMEVGDYLEAVVVKENEKLVAKEVSLRIGPVAEIDLLQGVVTKIDRRKHRIELKVMPGEKEEVLYLGEDVVGILRELKVGDRVEARVETVLEKHGPRRDVRVLVIGMGP